MALTDKLAAIADAIRTKTGKVERMTLTEMPDEISAIETGGDTEIEDALLTNGLLTSYTNSRITTLRPYALANMTTLKSVNLPNVTTYSNYAFYYCTALERFDTEKSISNAPYYLFEGCTALTSINMPLLTKIGQKFAYNCTSLVSVNLPSATSTIGILPFGNCTSLESISLPKLTNVGTQCFLNCIKLVNIDIPCATIIDQGGFQGCTALTYLDLPAVAQIKATAFKGSSLTTLILRNESLGTLANTSAFDSTPIASGTGDVYVPDELVESYKVATNWATYADQIKPLSELEEETE